MITNILLIVIVILSYFVIYIFAYNKFNNIKIESFKTIVSIEIYDNINSISTEFDKYIELFNKHDIEVRNLKESIIKEYSIKDHYNNNIVRNNKLYYNKLNTIIQSTINNLKHCDKKQFLLNKWKFVLFEDLENNFPHTHGDIILFPKNQIVDNLYTRITFVHEQVHVFQKQNGDLFENLYTNYWHFKKMNEFNINDINIPVRTNPDTLELNWLFTYKNCNIILLAKYTKNPNSLSNVEYIGYNPNTKNVELLNNIPEFIEFFGSFNNNNYHPYEISADMISKHCFDNYHNTIAYQQFKKWWKYIK